MKRRSFLSALGLGSILPFPAVKNKFRYGVNELISQDVDTPWDSRRGMLDVFTDLKRHPINKDTLQVHTINVASADATLIVTPNNKKILVDAGHSITKGWYVRNYLNRYNIKKLDHIIFTHGHWDHIGGFEDILRNYASKSDSIIETEYKNDTRIYQTYNRMLSDYQDKIVHATRGDNIHTETENLTIKIIHPSKEKVTGGPRPLNDNSCALKIDYEDTSILLPSDIERKAEQSILDSNTDIQSDIVRVCHHGGENCSTKEFLQQADPQVGIISCAYNDRFNRPHSDALERLSDQDVKLYWTGVNGSIITESDGSNWVIHKQMNMNRENMVENNDKVWKHPSSGYNYSISDTI